MLAALRALFKARTVLAVDFVFVLVSVSFIVCGWYHGGDFSTCYLPKLFN